MAKHQSFGAFSGAQCHPVVKTPHIGALAVRGMRFDPQKRGQNPNGVSASDRSWPNGHGNGGERGILLLRLNLTNNSLYVYNSEVNFWVQTGYNRINATQIPQGLY